MLRDRPTLVSRQTPTELPRACRLEVTTLHIERSPDGTVFFRDRPHMVPLVTHTRLRLQQLTPRSTARASLIAELLIAGVLLVAVAALLWQVVR